MNPVGKPFAPGAGSPPPELAGRDELRESTTCDRQMDLANPGMRFHTLAKGEDRNLCSMRVSSDIRLSIHKTPGGQRRDAFRSSTAGLSGKRTRRRSAQGAVAACPGKTSAR
jgi:hypothetical protein